MCVHCVVLGKLISSGSHTIDITTFEQGKGFIVHLIGPQIPKAVRRCLTLLYDRHPEFTLFNGGFKGIAFQELTIPLEKFKPQYSVAGLCTTQKKYIAKLARHGKTAAEINQRFGMTVVYVIRQTPLGVIFLNNLEVGYGFCPSFASILHLSTS